MKQLLKLLAAGSTITFLAVITVVLGVWSFTRPVPQDKPISRTSATIESETVQVAPTEDLAAHLAELEATAAVRKATYEDQLTTLQTTINERRTAYQAQLTEANNQLVTYQARMEQLSPEIQKLNEEISQLDQALAERKTTYQAQLVQIVEQLEGNRTQLLTQLGVARQALTEANVQLGR